MIPRIGEVYRERNWREIVSDLNAGPNFGIHGTERENLQRILDDQESTVYCHYFVIGDLEKRIPDSEFYQKLWASISLASRRSYSLRTDEEGIHFTGTPCILVATDQNYTGLFGNPRRERSNHFDTTYGETFGVGHEFFVGPDNLKLEDITIEDPELELISRRAARHYEQTPQYGDICKFYFVEREIIRSLIKKTHKVLKEEGK